MSGVVQFQQNQSFGAASPSGDIIKRMNNLMQDLEAVAKTSKNAQQGFNFRGIDTMLNVFKPLFVKHGIVMTLETLSHSQELREVTRSNGKNGIDKHVSMLLKYTFHSVGDGSTASTTVAAEGIDSGDKATTKALSMGLKYALIQTFTVPTEDIADGDADTPEISVQSTPKQVAAPVEKTSSASSVTPAATSTASTTTSSTGKAKFQRGNSLSSWSK